MTLTSLCAMFMQANLILLGLYLHAMLFSKLLRYSQSLGTKYILLFKLTYSIIVHSFHTRCPFLLHKVYLENALNSNTLTLTAALQDEG